MQNEQENNQTDAAKQSKIEQIKKFCSELDPDINVIIVGAGSGEAGHILKAMNGISSPLERARLINEHNAVEAPAALITEAMIREMYKTNQLCVIVDDADKLNIPVKEERTYTLTNSYIKPYELLRANDAYIGQTPDPKKKHWDKPTYMGGDEKIQAYRSGGNNRKTKKRKKAKNGRNKK